MIKFFERFTEIIGWFQIAISPTLIGLIIGLVIYYKFPTYYGLGIGIIIFCLGLYLGIKLATKKYKTTGTISFLSGVHSSSEIKKKSEIDKQ